jgi:hypothetical protein
MTIANSVRTAGPYTGTGGASIYPFSFKVFQASDVLVTSTDTAGVISTLGLASDYNVTLNTDQDNDPGGTVNMIAPLALGYVLNIAGNVPLTQPVALTNGGGFFPKVIEYALDRLTILIKQALVTSGSTLRVPELSGISEFPAAAQRALKLASFDQFGNATVVAPVSGSAADLAATLGASTGAAAVGFAPVGGISATNVQTAVAELDSEVRGGLSDTDAAALLVSARVTALEASATTGVIGKATQALLFADLAWGAGTIAYVTNDSTAANNGVYRKVGSSGSGSWTQSSSTPGAVDAETATKLGYAVATEVQTYGDAVVAMKVATDRWVIRTPVSGGEPHDYAEYVMFNMGAYMGITHAWSLHSVRASIGGVMTRFIEQSVSAGNVSTNEFAINAGTGATLDSTYDFYGFGHGNMAYTGLSINLDGGATNYRDLAPVGTILRGATFTFNGSFNAKTKAGTVIGTVAVAHVFDGSGLRVSHQHNITAPSIYAQNSYSAMCTFTGVDRIKAEGQTATVVGAKDGSQVGNWGAITKFAGYYNSRPTHLLEMSLAYGHPGTPPGDWSQATTSRTFVLDNANGIRKLYVNWRSGPSPVVYSGTYNFLTDYRVRLGAAL